MDKAVKMNETSSHETLRPGVILPDGYFSTLHGRQYLAMAGGGSKYVVVQVPPGEDAPDSGFTLEDNGWLSKVYATDQVERVFRRDTIVAWHNSLWYVPDVMSDGINFVGRYISGYTPFHDLELDPRTEPGIERGDLLAHLTIRDVDAIKMSETEIINGKEDESTTRQILSWRRQDLAR